MTLSLLSEVLVISGVAMDLVGAVVLSHAHNAESIVELREEIGAEGSAVGESDAISTHAQLLAEKRIGFLLLSVGLALYLTGLVLKGTEDTLLLGGVAAAVLAVGVVTSLAFTKVFGTHIREQAREASRNQDPDALPEQ